MAENKHDLEQPPVGFERTDVNVWAIGKFGIALVLICIASLGMLLVLFHYLIAREGPAPPKAYSDLAGAGVKRAAGAATGRNPGSGSAARARGRRSDSEQLRLGG